MWGVSEMNLERCYFGKTFCAYMFCQNHLRQAHSSRVANILFQGAISGAAGLCFHFASHVIITASCYGGVGL